MNDQQRTGKAEQSPSEALTQLDQMHSSSEDPSATAFSYGTTQDSGAEV